MVSAATIVLAVAVVGVWAASSLAAPATRSQASLNQRLSKSQWASYQASHKSFAATTRKSVARFRRCRTSTGNSQNAKALTACLGNSVQAELRATLALMTTLGGFQGKVGGNCGKSVPLYLGALQLWRSTVAAIQRSAGFGNPASMQTAIGNALTAYKNVTKAETQFPHTCAPA